MNKELIKHDFFDAVNKKWIDKTKIPNDRRGWGTFYILDKKLTDLQKRLFNKWLTDTSDIENYPMLIEMMKFYKLVKDWDSRKQNGLKPLKDILTKIEAMQSWDDVVKNYRWLTFMNLQTPLSFDLGDDFKDPGRRVFWMNEYQYILPEKGYYEDEKKREKYLTVWKEMTSKLLNKLYSQDKSSEIINNALTLDLNVSKYILTAEEQHRYYELYNPRTIEELQAKIEIFNVKQLIELLVDKKETKFIVVPSLIHLDNFNKIFTKDNFEQYKASLIIDVILTFAPYLDHQTKEIATEFQSALYGKVKVSKEKVALNQTLSIYSMVYGKYYGENYFGIEAKRDVEKMIEAMKQIYKENLLNNDWLEDATKQMAIKKIEKMNVMVGYPELIEPYYDELTLDSHNGYDDLVQHVIKFRIKRSEYLYSQYQEYKNQKLWSMSPAMVNAYFNPSANHIVFPAGILQAPFYSIKQTPSQNFGAIGTVIAHEISHSFDNNGSKFDENGMLKNWWTKNDEEKFNIKIQQMIKLFDKVKFHKNIRCNGTLTVSENIADCGGLSCSYDSAKLIDPNFNPKAFFTQYAIIWRIKYREEFLETISKIDPHAPAKLRVNLQLKNNQEFQKTFKIKKGDKMYLSPKKMFKIW